MEFKAFSEIKRWSPVTLTVTQKIHGSNGQILVYEKEPGVFDVKVGSRTKWIFPGKTTDNYGFAQFVEDNKQEIIEKLGPGTHFGEWAGPGINSGEGLKEKTFVLFNHTRPYPNGLPPRMTLVPVLYNGPVVHLEDIIANAMDDLKVNGSKLVPGFMRVEGVVIELNGTRRKKVFQAEETAWTGKSGAKPPKEKGVDKDYSYLLQPIRLEKLLSRDEAYVREYPGSLPAIMKDYMADLEKEGQLPSDPDELKAAKKQATGQVFSFIKQVMNQFT
jgi:hypothetical protein